MKLWKPSPLGIKAPGAVCLGFRALVLINRNKFLGRNDYDPTINGYNPE
jgi:hypothetical protein